VALLLKSHGSVRLTKSSMALPLDSSGVRDARTLSILAKSIYRELRGNGFEARDVIALAGELLAQLTTEVQEASDKERGRDRD
jgi:hypothetical protein